MKQVIKLITFIGVLIGLTGITVENPAPKLFSVAFGTDVKTILSNIIILVLGFAGLIALVYIIIGGYQIATARGNTTQADAGKKTLTNAIIGLVIIILSYTIISIVVNAAFGYVR